MIAQAGQIATDAFWGVTKFMLGIMEMLEFLSASFLGVGTTVDNYLSFAENNGLTKTYVRTFKAICAVAIVLMIIFTIMAIVRQEIANATSPNGFSAKQNSKTPIIMKLLKNIMSIIVLPIAMIIIIGGVNSVLTAFRKAISGDVQMTVAQSVLYSSSYDVNRARNYASSNRRIPTIIKYYDADKYLADEKDKLYDKIESSVVQQNLANTKIWSMINV